MALFYESNEKTQSPAFENLTDVDLDQNTLANGQVPVYNATTRKWENAVVDVGNKFNSDNVAPIETGNVASQSYTVGSHLVWNGIYYEVIQAIAVGEPFSVNVNIKQDTINGEINKKTIHKIATFENMTLQNIYSSIYGNNDLKTLIKDGKISLIKMFDVSRTYHFTFHRNVGYDFLYSSTYCTISGNDFVLYTEMLNITSSAGNTGWIRKKETCSNNGTTSQLSFTKVKSSSDVVEKIELWGTE